MGDEASSLKNIYPKYLQSIYFVVYVLLGNVVIWAIPQVSLLCETENVIMS